MRLLPFDSKSNGASTTGPPFPTGQFVILGLVRLCEPIAFMSIFPYSYQMVESFKVTSDPGRIAMFTGLITASFAFAEFLTGMLWGRLSDRVGRKPVLIGGLAGTALSMLMFGFSRSLPVALVARALGGLLNGNIGVLQTTVAELVKSKEQQPRAYSIMPFIWSLGTIIGPSLGGALAQPCQTYPTIFRSGTIFDKYPFLLANLLCFMILVCGVLVGVLFLEETHEVQKHRRDRGLEAGRWLLKNFLGQSMSVAFATGLQEAQDLETHTLLSDEQPPEYRTTENTPRASCSSNEEFKDVEGSEPAPVATPKAFTKQVILLIANFGILAYHTMSFDQLMPVVLSSPPSQQPTTLPFKFLGGFGLTTSAIGVMMSLAGIYAMTAQLYLFPFMVRRYGALRTYRGTLLSWPLLYMIVPYIALLPPWLQKPCAFLCLLWRTTNQALSYPSFSILINHASPSMLVLGLINGVAGSSASLSRAVGPTVTGIIHSWGISMGYAGLSWWVSGLVCLIGGIEALWINDRSPQPVLDEKIPTTSEKSEDDDPVEPDSVKHYPCRIRDPDNNVPAWSGVSTLLDDTPSHTRVQLD